MRAKRIAIGDTYFDGAEMPWEAEDADGNPIDLNADLVVEGNVGIGTTSPNAQLDVFGIKPEIRLTTSAQVGGTDRNWAIGNATNPLPHGTFGIYSGATEGSTILDQVRLVIDNSGKVGIGTISPGYRLEVRSASAWNTSHAIARFGDIGFQRSLEFGESFVSDSYSYIQARSGSTGVNDLLLNPYGGSVSIGTTSSYPYKLAVNGQPAAVGYTAFTNISDARLKKNIEPLDNGIMGKILKLKPVTFNYNEKTKYDEEVLSRRLRGFIAQDIQKIFPDMIGEIEIDNKTYLDTNLTNLQVYLVKALQELKLEKDAEIAELKLRIQALEAK
ncbi:MAG: tail fiber domain-containing protein [Candidatus Omnitrophica bacterium]|nr:tail fiber domain-containing protein [Candidatus Omnitrophota bacterium]